MRRAITCAVAAALALGPGCAKRKGGRPAVGVSLPAAPAPSAIAFDQDLRRGMQHVADSLDVELRIVAARDLTAQIAQIGSFVTARLDAIVIAPLDAAGVAGAIEEANRARIPVFTTGTAADGGRVVSHVASDDRAGGQALGDYVARRLHGGGNVVVLHQPTIAAVRERVAGFRAALGLFPNIRIVAAPALEGGLREAARQKTSDLLATDQRIDAIFGASDDGALGAVDALEAAGRKDIFVVAYDAGPATRRAINQGSSLVAAAVQHPDTVGRYLVEVVAAHLRGNRVAPQVPVRVSLVARDSLGPR